MINYLHRIKIRLSNFSKSKLFRVSIANGAAQFIKILVGLVSNKVVAVLLGPAGIALMGQFSNFVSMSLSFSTMGMNMGVTKYVAEYKDNDLARKNILSTSFILISSLSLITSLIVYIWRDYFSRTFLLSNEYTSIFSILSFTLIFYGLNSFFIAVLNGFKEFRKVIITGIVSSVGGLIISIILVYEYGVYGALLGSILSQTLVFFFNLRWVVSSEWFKIDYFIKYFKRDDIRKLGKYTLMAIASLISTTFVQLQIRTYIINHLSIEEAGYWQAVTKISGLYLGLFTATFGLYFVPRFSEIISNTELRCEIVRGYKFIIPITILISGSIFLLKNQIIVLLFSPTFYPMKGLFIYQLIGDLFRISSLLLGYLFHAKAIAKGFILFEFCFGLLNFTLSILFIALIGLRGVVLAYLFLYIIYFISLLIYFKDIVFLRK